MLFNNALKHHHIYIIFMILLQRRFITIFALILILLTPVAGAADISEAGADKLHRIFTDYIDAQKSLTEINPGMALVTDGKVEVEQAGTYYAVTLPHLSIAYPDGGRFEIGMISINATPHKKQGQWKMTMALPTPLTYFDAEEAAILQVDIGPQKTAGLWDEDLNYFSKLEAVYDDFTVTAPQDKGFTLHIARLKTLFNMKEDGQGRWSGPGSIRAEDIKLNAENLYSAAIDTAEVSAHIDRYDPELMQDYREKINALNASADQEQARSRAHIEGLYNLFSETYMTIWDGMEARYAFSGLDINWQGRGLNPAGRAGFGKLAAGFKLDGILDDQVALGFEGEFEDFRGQTTPAALNDFNPRAGYFRFEAGNVPVKQLADLVKNSFSAVETDPALAQMAGLSLMIKIPALLSQAGTVIEFDTGLTGAEDLYKMQSEGILQADISALNSATAKARAEFHGLDRTLEKARRLLTGAGEKEAEDLQKLIKQLETLQSLAEKQTGEDIYVLEFTMNEQGKMLLNGEDAIPALGAEAPE